MTRFGWLLAGLILFAAALFALMVAGGRHGFGGGPAEIAPPAASAPARASLVIPVAGVRADQLVDSFGDARTAGGAHVHGAIDIAAPRGAPVVAAAAGTVEKIYEDARGGHTVYERSEDGGTIYYYAHLDRYAPALAEGQHLPQGQLIGAVGTTGDASAEGPHLHFEIKRMTAGDRWWQGRGVDPYKLLGGR